MSDSLLSLVSIEDYEKRKNNISGELFFGYPASSIVQAEKNLLSKDVRSIAYFCMEYGLAPSIYNTFNGHQPVSDENKFTHHEVFSNLRTMDYFFSLNIDKMLDMPIYSGGLGVLAGDTLKSAADMKLSMAAVGLLWSAGYFKQNFWFQYGQVPEEMHWDPYSYPGLVPLKNIIKIELEGAPVYLKLWKYFVYSYDKKHVVPLILLDADIKKNSDKIRKLTGQLYRSDSPWWKISQRAILGIGGIAALDELGYSIDMYHLNEGHAALAFIERTKGKFSYTCHTPVAAGHDRFYVQDLEKMLKKDELELLKKFGRDEGDPKVINLTTMALSVCEHVNGVSKKHGEVTRLQFPKYKNKIESITNGIHTHTWVSQPMAELFDKYKKAFGDWRQDPTLLKNAVQLKSDKGFRADLWSAHQENKKYFAKMLERWQIKENVFTVAWARRIAAYKRPSLIFEDPKRLLDIAKRVGQIQIVLAGKAHPMDNLGATHINEMLNAIDLLSNERESVRVIMLENYDTYFGKLLTNCVDVWLNNPLPPFEASGTSGMKAILNGVLQLSTLDGWVVEAADANIGKIFGYRHTGTEIGDEGNLRFSEDSKALYTSLEEMAALYYKTNESGRLNVDSQWIDMMINCISQAGYFNTHRMLSEYQQKIWKTESYAESPLRA